MNKVKRLVITSVATFLVVTGIVGRANVASFFNTDSWMKQGKNIRMSFNHVKDIVTSDTRGRAIIPAYIHKGEEFMLNF